MVNLVEYAYYKLCRFNAVVLKESTTYYAGIQLGGLISINLCAVISVIFQSRPSQIGFLASIIFSSILVTICAIREEKIYKKYSIESDKCRRIGNALVLLFAIESVAVFVASLQYW